MTAAYTSDVSLLNWSLRAGETEQAQKLEQIHQWWASLKGKTILWQVFIEPIHLTPLISYYCQVKEAKARNIVFDWCREGVNNWNTFTAKEMTLDLQKQELAILPHSFSNYRYQLTVVDPTTKLPIS
jgi:hypothetical protein